MNNNKEPKLNPSPFQQDRNTRREADIINHFLKHITQEFIDYLVEANREPLPEDESARPSFESQRDEAIAKKFLDLSRRWIRFCKKKWKYNTMNLNAFEKNVASNIKAFNLTFKNPNENVNTEEKTTSEQQADTNSNDQESSLKVVN